ncbi:MAG TPA: hypothetical protein VGM37_16515 [Armatimonadota bacterium]|jgi:hypothetical protein
MTTSRTTVLALLAVVVPTTARAGTANFPTQVIPDCFGVNMDPYTPSVPALKYTDAEMKKMRAIAGSVRSGLMRYDTETGTGDAPRSANVSTENDTRNGGGKGIPIHKIVRTAYLAMRNGMNVQWVVSGGKKEVARVVPTKGGAATPAAGSPDPVTAQQKLQFTQWACSSIEQLNAWKAAKRGTIASKRFCWEIWNEPNGSFWQGSSPVEYADLVKYLVPRIRETDANASIMVGSLSIEHGAFYDLQYVERLGQLGILPLADAFSVHPYGSDGAAPETMAGFFNRLRQILHKYSPDRELPIAVTEGGWRSAPDSEFPANQRDNETYQVKGKIRESLQAKYLARARLFGLSRNIVLTQTFSWRDRPDVGLDGWGIMRRYDLRNRSAAKPAYEALRQQCDKLNGFRFVCMLADPDLGDARTELKTGVTSGDYVMLLRNDDSRKYALAMWTTDAAPHKIRLPWGGGTPAYVTALGSGGEWDTDTESYNADSLVPISTSPTYVVFGALDRVTRAKLDLYAAVEWLKPYQGVAASASSTASTPASMVVYNYGPSSEAISVSAALVRQNGAAAGLVSSPPSAVTVPAGGQSAALSVPYAQTWRQTNSEGQPISLAKLTVSAGDASITQYIPLVIANAITVKATPVLGATSSVGVFIDSPEGSVVGADNVAISLNSPDSLKLPAATATVDLAAARNGRVTVPVNVTRQGTGQYGYGVEVRAGTGPSGPVIASVARTSFRLLAGRNFESGLGGFNIQGYKGMTSLPLSVSTTASPDPDAGSLHGHVASVDIKWGACQQQHDYAPSNAAPPGAKALGMWVYGDNSMTLITTSYVSPSHDSDILYCDWVGWKWIEMPYTDGSLGTDLKLIPSALAAETPAGPPPGQRQPRDTHIKVDDISWILR